MFEGHKARVQQYGKVTSWLKLTYCRASGLKRIEKDYAPVKPRAEREHFDEKLSGTMMPFEGGIKTYPELHGLTDTEHTLEKDMGIKRTILGFDDKRNQIPFAALGDKPYKYTEDSVDFYRPGGLIPGSSQPHKLDKRSTGSTKIVDYYANLDLSKRVPSKGLKWKDKLRLEALEEDKKAVNELIQWLV